MAIKDRITDYDRKTQHEWFAIAKVNEGRIALNQNGNSNTAMANALVKELTIVNPYRIWMATSYDNIGGDNKHQVRCYDCFSDFHKYNKYNIVVTGLPKNTVGDYGIVSNSYIRT